MTMCYRCEVCKEVSEPGVPQHRHPVYRVGPERRQLRNARDPYNGRPVKVGVDVPPQPEIEREVVVCPACRDALHLGVPLPTLIQQRGKPKVVRVQTVHVPYREEVVPVAPPPPRQGRVTFGTELSAKLGNIIRPVFPMKIMPTLLETELGPVPFPPLCDVCGNDARDGQRTADSVLCVACCNKAKR